jgi:uncharacterized protein YdhG (YjbR/CyaY superfamily)
MSDPLSDVDGYVGGFPAPVREVLDSIRRTLHEAVPGAGEAISYDVASLTLDGRPFVWFAGWSRHVSLYPVPGADEALIEALATYRSGKGTLKFVLAKPVPYELVARVGAALAEQARG